MTSMPSILVVVFACISLGSSEAQSSELEHKNTNFDIYIFTLHWPYTTCLDWSKRGHGRHCAHIGNRLERLTLITLPLRRPGRVECPRPVAHSVWRDQSQLLQQFVDLQPRSDEGHPGGDVPLLAGR